MHPRSLPWWAVGLLAFLYFLPVLAGCTTSGSGGITCRPCLTAADCGSGGACIQYAGSDYCALTCPGNSTCAGGTTCVMAVAGDGTQVSACVPTNGSCGSGGCGQCPSGTECDLTTGQCKTTEDGGTDGGDSGGTCGPYDSPDTSSCCSSCTPGQGNCQTNGCYGGWWCNRDQCRCHAPPTDCGGTDGGGFDGGPPTDISPPTGTVGPDGGSVSRLYFAVVGDTRPNLSNDTAGYPTGIITTIYQDIAAMQPAPEFVITTGDYMFADSTGSSGAAQMQLYLQARNNYSGTVFPVMGNHECNGYTADNCAGSSSSNNLQAFTDALMNPLGKSNLYYTIPINDLNGQWTAKLVFVACNAWDSNQKTWLQGELANATTYTFVISHEPLGSGAPCDNDLNSVLQSATYNLLIVGHTHTYNHSAKQLIEGVGGAPISGSANYGYAVIDQLPAGGFGITQRDYKTNQVVGYFTVP